ncbi:MAG: endonuclease MutS2, partial [Clostridia bacterium]
LGRYLERHEELVRLTNLAEALDPDPTLEKAIRECITEDGQVADGASSELRRIRRSLRDKSEELRRKLEGLLRSPELKNHLQEAIVTQRNGRYVVPVRQESRGRVRGIVHGQSSSGATVFIEPQVVVDMNNHLRELQDAEDAEIMRILGELSSQVRGESRRLRTEQDALGRLDFIYARAMVSADMDASAPLLNDRGYLKLVRARHPLLAGNVVPLDVEIGEDFHTLVVTGPNTGGKTVTLKTIGLLTLMAHSGLHIPAEPESEIAMFRGVYCDIGDEQSIAQNLSTFSSHMSNVVPILRYADFNTLVLLDELGAGTDPAEGAPLAIGILSHLHELGVRTVASTHYGQLKSFVYGLEGAANASMQFDATTLSPTYRLVLGTPGRSNAFEIAARLGIPEDVLARARRAVSGEEMDAQSLLRAIEEDRRAWEESRRQLESELGDAEKLRRRAERREEYLRGVQEDMLAATRAQLRRLMDDTREEANALLRDIHQLVAQFRTGEYDGGDPKEALRRAEEMRRRTIKLRDRAEGYLEAKQDEIVPPREEGEMPGEENVVAEDLRPGQHVRVISLDRPGHILETNEEDGDAEVQIGVVRMRLPLSDLEPTEAPEEQENRMRLGEIARMKGETLSERLNIRQHTVEEALPRLAKYLDDVLLAGGNHATILHGRGTGTLRDAVRDYLEKHPQVESWRPGHGSEGGDGITVALLR